MRVYHHRIVIQITYVFIKELLRLFPRNDGIQNCHIRDTTEYTGFFLRKVDY